jgi:hypothetical protein
MPDNEKLSLIPLPGSALAKQSPVEDRVLSAMVGEALLLVRRQQTSLQAERFRIGDHELCGPDYRQILHWATSLELAPEIFLERLFFERHLAGRISDDHPLKSWAGTKIRNGQLVSIHWDAKILPLSLLRLVENIATTALSFEYDGSDVISTLELKLLPFLARLDCSWTSVSDLDLSAVPRLTELRCNSTNITELDLFPVQGLTKLFCCGTKVTELDLSPTPRLTALGCGLTGITKLDLLPMPELAMLSCWGTKITELNLAHVPALSELYCNSDLAGKMRTWIGVT